MCFCGCFLWVGGVRRLAGAPLWASSARYRCSPHPLTGRAAAHLLGLGGSAGSSAARPPHSPHQAQRETPSLPPQDQRDPLTTPGPERDLLIPPRPERDPLTLPRTRERRYHAPTRHRERPPYCPQDQRETPSAPPPTRRRELVRPSLAVLVSGPVGRPSPPRVCVLGASWGRLRKGASKTGLWA